MAYYRICPNCGAALDPGEKCDCEDEENQRQIRAEQLYKQEAGSGQLTFNWFPERMDT